MAERGEPVRLSDVAARAGVSLATVSRSLTGSPGVSDAVAERVRAVAATMGYVVNPHARLLAGGSSTSVGLVVSNIGDPYFSEIARGVIETAAEVGRPVQICHAADEESLLAQIRLLRQQRVGAIVIAGSGHDEAAADAGSTAELADFRSRGGRLAVIGRHHVDADAVLPDNVGAGRALGAHLLQLGHERVAVLAGPEGLSVVTDRLEGLREELGGRILRLTHHEFSRAGGVEGARALLAVDAPDAAVTAVVALNDLMALGALAVLREAGVAVPENLSVVGCDDIEVAADVSPALTTVRLPMAEIGTEAMRLVMAPQSPETRTVETGHELIVRASTAPPVSP